MRASEPNENDGYDGDLDGGVMMTDAMDATDFWPWRIAVH